MPLLATRARSWVQDICRQFSLATGYTLDYTPVGPEDAGIVESSLQNDPNCCWFSGIDDGDRRVGYLHIEFSSALENDGSMLAVCDLADIIAQLLNKYSTEERLVASRTEEVSTLVDLGLPASKQEDLFSTLNRLLRAAVQLTGFRAAAFFLLDPSTNELNLRVVHGLEEKRDGQERPSSMRSGADCRRVDFDRRDTQDGQECPSYRGETPFARRNLAQNPPDLEALVRGKTLVRRDGSAAGERWLPPGTTTGVCLAVQSETGPLGSLWVFDRRDRTPAQSEYHVLDAVAAQMAGMLERVVLLQESEVQLRLKRELRVASENETRDITKALKGRVGFEAAAVCTSRFEVGGDLCELVPLDEHRTVIAVGDASGDSIPAALVMAAVRGALRTLTNGPQDDVCRTERIVQQINQTLHAITPAHQFMSLLYGVLDTREQTLTYTNAGHPAPILVHFGRTSRVDFNQPDVAPQGRVDSNRRYRLPHGPQISQLTSHGMLLGVIEDATYDQSVVQLAPGDMLVLFSDGISEAMTAHRKMFRTEGIIETIRASLPASADDVLQAILERLEAHCIGGSDPDDRTLLVIRVP